LATYLEEYAFQVLYNLYLTNITMNGVTREYTVGGVYEISGQNGNFPA